MAFGDYGNPYYYGSQQYSPRPQQTVSQNNGGTFYWVNNEQEAREWSLPPNGAVMLMDRNQKVFYLKACDGFGMVLYFKRYPYAEDKQDTPADVGAPQPAPTESAPDYVSREEYTQELASLRAELDDLKNMRMTQPKKEAVNNEQSNI